ncbi:MAG: aromatic amino acid hydroxylase [Pseudomonadota bacterium]
MKLGSTYDRLPHYLKGYVVNQNYEKYTSADQAAWRFIMRQSRRFFSENAHPIWLRGLKETGVPLTEIPRIEDMDRALQNYGWGACCICGFIPPSAFLEFLAFNVLPIAADMRTLEHIDYTPAPDIVHEAAGHAPILADLEYRNYLTHYAKLARKAIYSIEDIRLYEAIRLLSDSKENPDATKAEIAAAQEALTKAVNSMTWVSEASKVARMSWWTIEYGLIGDFESPKIYGAGLLSSIGEARECLSPRIQKVPLSLACIDQSYDITEPQPQLFIARDFKHMSEVLTELEDTMAYKIGGLEGLEIASRAKTVTTVQFENQLGVSGTLAKMHVHEGQPSYLFWEGPVQLSLQEKELSGQGIRRHPSGFSMPIGTILNSKKNTSELEAKDLQSLGIRKGAASSLAYTSGVMVEGVVKDIVFQNEKAIYIVWQDCHVTLGSQSLYSPEWGEFDMPLCSEVASVFGGPADQGLYGAYDIGKASSAPSRSTPYSAEEIKIQALFTQIKSLRVHASTPDDWQRLMGIAADILNGSKFEWLLAIELLEVLALRNIEIKGSFEELKQRLQDHSKHSEASQRMIRLGLELLTTPD